MPDSFKFYATQITSTSNVTVVSGLTGTRIINSINIANPSTAGTAAVSVLVFSGTNSFTLIPSQALATQASVQVLSSPLALTTTDDIQVSAATGSEPVDVIISSLERTA